MQRIHKMARPTDALSRQDIRSMDQLCEVGKEVCRLSTGRLIGSAQDDPLMQSCSADGTPVTVSMAAAVNLPSGRVVRRFGKSSHEFLVSAQFTRHEDVSGVIHDSLVTRDPVPLTNGKGADQIFEATRSIWRSLRQHGHKGGAVQHYCFDRCGFEKLARRTHQWHGLLESKWAQGDEHLEMLLPLLEWVVVSACSCHDIHNSFKWGMPHYFGDTDLVRDCFIGVAAVRNSFDIVLACIGQWVAESLTPSIPFDGSERYQWRQVWTALQLH